MSNISVHGIAAGAAKRDAGRSVDEMRTGTMQKDLDAAAHDIVQKATGNRFDILLGLFHRSCSHKLDRSIQVDILEFRAETIRPGNANSITTAGSGVLASECRHIIESHRLKSIAKASVRFTCEPDGLTRIVAELELTDGKSATHERCKRTETPNQALNAIVAKAPKR